MKQHRVRLLMFRRPGQDLAMWLRRFALVSPGGLPPASLSSIISRGLAANLSLALVWLQTGAAWSQR